MPNHLAEGDYRAYADHGFVGPIPVISTAEANELWQRLQAHAARRPDIPLTSLRGKAHVPFPWLTDLVFDPRLVDLVEPIVGPNILCWGSTLWVKPAHHEGYVSWHQDGYLLGLDPPESCSLWLALTECTPENGAMRYLPGHHVALEDHHRDDHHGNLLAAKQAISGIAPDAGTMIPLHAGEAVMFHECAPHASGANATDLPRVGINIHYIAPTVRHHGRQGGSALLVRGKNETGIWEHDPLPASDPDPDGVAQMRRAYGTYVAEANDEIDRSSST